jgi:hypothetical protein
MTLRSARWACGLLRVVAPAGIIAFVLRADPAAAQSVPSAPVRSLEVAVGALWVGSLDLGRSTAGLLRADRSLLTLFSAETRLGPGAGIEVHVATAVTPGFAVEASAAWTRIEMQAAVSGDFEGVPSTTLTAVVSRASVEGSALWTVRRTDRASIFVRAGAGWMRELAGDFTLMEDGVVGNAGAGVKYWWGADRANASRRLGLRVDGRAALRYGGIAVGSRVTRVAPAVSASLLIGF